MFQWFVGLAIVVATVTGCGTQPTTPPMPPVSSAPPSTVTTSPSAPPAETFNIADYEANPQRLARLAEAMRAFGAVVVQQRVTGHSTWGRFDGYCSDIMEGGTNDGGWLSKGYKPMAGEDCSIQHNPQYGGTSSQIEADVLVGADGTFTNQVVEVTIHSAACTALVTYNRGESSVEVGDSPDLRLGNATSLSQALSIDTQAISCMNNTRPRP